MLLQGTLVYNFAFTNLKGKNYSELHYCHIKGENWFLETLEALSLCSEAVYKGKIETWCSIGFRRSTNVPVINKCYLTNLLLININHIFKFPLFNQ